MKIKKSFIVLSVITITAAIIFSCSIAGAAEFIPYFKIAKDYVSNESEARARWISQDICVEGNILVSAFNQDGNKVIALYGKSLVLPFEYVTYMFTFDGVPEETTGLVQGQKVRISGKVQTMEIDKDLGSENQGAFIILLVSPRLIQAEATEFTHFFRIPDDADRDFEATKRTWIGKRISIEGQVLNSQIDHEYNYIVVHLYAQTRVLSSINEVGYMFFFNGIPEEAAELKEGQKVRISGKIIEIVKGDKVIITSLASSLLLF